MAFTASWALDAADFALLFAWSAMEVGEGNLGTEGIRRGSVGIGILLDACALTATGTAAAAAMAGAVTFVAAWPTLIFVSPSSSDWNSESSPNCSDMFWIFLATLLQQPILPIFQQYQW